MKINIGRDWDYEQFCDPHKDWDNKKFRGRMVDDNLQDWEDMIKTFVVGLRMTTWMLRFVLQ